MARRRSDRIRSTPDSLSGLLTPERFLTGLDQARALIRSIEDRRLFHPERDYRPALSFGRRSTLVISSSAGIAGRQNVLPARVRFDVPEKVAKCVRRKERREVLFAKRKTRKGAGSRRRRDWWSDVSC